MDDTIMSLIGKERRAGLILGEGLMLKKMPGVEVSSLKINENRL